MGNNHNWFRRIYTGAKYAPLKLIITFLVTFTAGWSLIEPILGLAPESSKDLVGANRLALLVIVSFIVALYRIARPTQISFNFQNNKITIEFADLFQQEGFRVIPVSRFMHETEVIASSLQANVIRKFIENGEGANGLSSYLEKLNAALTSNDHIVTQRDAERGIENNIHKEL